MRDPENIRAVCQLQPDYLGFIFYPKSPRYAGNLLNGEFPKIPEHIRTTAVLVNTPLQEVQQMQAGRRFDVLQLHGTESPEYCAALRLPGVEIIKAFGAGAGFPWDSLQAYAPYVDYFLFDTRTPGYGGSGKTFDWSILEAYPLEQPYFLSGGLSPENIKRASQIKDSRLYALDLNSGFEHSPGIKDISLLKHTLTQIRQ